MAAGCLLMMMMMMMTMMLKRQHNPAQRGRLCDGERVRGMRGQGRHENEGYEKESGGWGGKGRKHLGAWGGEGETFRGRDSFFYEAEAAVDAGYEVAVEASGRSNCVMMMMIDD